LRTSHRRDQQDGGDRGDPPGKPHRGILARAATDRQPLDEVQPNARPADDLCMELDGRTDLLAHADVLGDAVATMGEPVPSRVDPPDDLPMSDEQAAFIAHLRRRIGRAHDAAGLTFEQAKRHIAALLDELAP